MGGNLIDYLNILIEEALIQSPALLTYDEADNYKARFKALFDQQKQELLDALTIEKKHYIWLCGGDDDALEDESHLLFGTSECAKHNMASGQSVERGYNAASDELEARKQKIREGI